MSAPPSFLTIAELAEHLRCQQRVARSVARDIGYVTVGKRMLVRRDWLENWEQANRTLEPSTPAGPPAPRRRRRAQPVPDLTSLPHDWWRHEADPQ